MSNVALITTSYPDSTPGSEAAGGFVADFANELAKLVRVTVIAASREASVSRSGDLTVIRFEVPRTPLSLLKLRNPLDWLAIIKSLRAGQRAVREAIETSRPDHILALWALPSGWWASREAGARGIPYSTWALGSDIWSLGRVPPVRRVLRGVLGDATARYADGLALCREVEQICDLPCSFLPSSRCLPSLREHAVAARPPFKLAFLGRWHPNKGTDLLMQALRTLDDDDWSKIADLQIFGGGPQENELRAAVDRLVADRRPVTVGGYLDKNDAARLIASADYLLLPSRIESIPVIYSDAVQLGTPMISTPVGDLPRLHQKYETGILAGDVTSASFAAAIRAALADDPGRFVPPLAAARETFDLNRIVVNFVRDLGLSTR